MSWTMLKAHTRYRCMTCSQNLRDCRCPSAFNQDHKVELVAVGDVIEFTEDVTFVHKRSTLPKGSKHLVMRLHPNSATVFGGFISFSRPEQWIWHGNTMWVPSKEVPIKTEAKMHAWRRTAEEDLVATGRISTTEPRMHNMPREDNRPAKWVDGTNSFFQALEADRLATEEFERLFASPRRKTLLDKVQAGNARHEHDLFTQQPPAPIHVEVIAESRDMDEPKSPNNGRISYLKRQRKMLGALEVEALERGHAAVRRRMREWPISKASGLPMTLQVTANTYVFTTEKHKSTTAEDCNHVLEFRFVEPVQNNEPRDN